MTSALTRLPLLVPAHILPTVQAVAAQLARAGLHYVRARLCWRVLVEFIRARQLRVMRDCRLRFELNDVAHLIPQIENSSNNVAYHMFSSIRLLATSFTGP